MPGPGIDIKLVSDRVYSVTVVVKGEPLIIDMERGRAVVFGSLGSFIFKARGSAVPSASAKYAPFVPFWMDNSVIRSGPNKVQYSGAR
jgi:hypothetical protein